MLLALMLLVITPKTTSSTVYDVVIINEYDCSGDLTYEALGLELEKGQWIRRKIERLASAPKQDPSMGMDGIQSMQLPEISIEYDLAKNEVREVYTIQTWRAKKFVWVKSPDTLTNKFSPYYRKPDCR